MSDLPATRRPNRLRDTSGKNLLALARVQRMIAAIMDGKTIKDAAKAGNMTVMRAKLCLRDPVVRKAYMRQLEDLRESERARNIHAAIKIRDAAFDDGATAATKKVALDAARYLDGDTGGSGGTTVNVNVTPGYVIDLSGAAEPPRVIEHHAPMRRNPLSDIEDVGE
ncbi:hypothetical protein [Microcystis phage Mwe-JY08]